MTLESKKPETELEWVRKAQDGDLEAFESLVSLYEKRIYNIARRLLESEADAEDVLQEAFLKAFEGLGKFRGEASFYTWLVKIAVNACLQRLHQRKKWATVSLNDTDERNNDDDYRPREVVIWEDNPEKIYSRKELREILNAAISSLPTIYRMVFLLKDMENLSADQVAGILGISLPATKSRLIRARLELRERLGNHFRKKSAEILPLDHTHG
ncbi:MAG TPA: sigma-70 family RNA polymerase sigma factor [Terriglobia bacterium]|nr:sigma-70 family RNA polymerase sigma factor [Terriglobia bacterium]